MSDPVIKLINDNTRLVIEVDMLNPPRVSKSGKCMLMASGMIKSGIMVEGKEMSVGINAMVPVKDKPPRKVKGVVAQ